MAEEKKEKKTGRHGSGLRPHRTEVYFTDKEWENVNSLMAFAGEKSLPVFLRELAINKGTVIAALTEDERKSITDLGKMGTNIWKTRNTLIALINENKENKQMIPELQKTIDELKTLYDEFAEIKNYFKEKVQK